MFFLMISGQCIYILCNSLLNNQTALSFNINTLSGYIFIARLNLDLRVSDRERKHACLPDSFDLYGIFSYMNERNTSSLDCKHKHVLQKAVFCTICYI